MIFVVAWAMRPPIEAYSFVHRVRAILVLDQAPDASDEVQGVAGRVEREQTFDHSAAYLRDHLLQRLLHLLGTRRLAVASREAGREGDAPWQARFARFRDEFLEARQIVESLVDAHHWLECSATARLEALALRSRRVFRQLGSREDKEQPLGLELGRGRSEQLVEMRRLVHFGKAPQPIRGGFPASRPQPPNDAPILVVLSQ